jgi:hypothetical protein
MTMRNFILAAFILTLALDSVCAQPAPNSAQPVILPPEVPAALTSGSSTLLDPLSQEPPRIWVSADYLMYWVKRAPLRTPLVTTDPTNGATATAGGLADPTTQVLLGNTDINYHAFSGVRLGAGYSLSENIALEGSVFYLGSQTRTLGVGADPTGNPFLFRPVSDVDTGNPNAGTFVSLPGFVTGQVQVSSSINLWGADAVFAATLWRTRTTTLDALIGFRYLDLFEKLDIQDNRMILAPGFANFGAQIANPGDIFSFQDSFHTRNQFYGGVLGLRGEKLLGNWTLSGTARVAFGDTHQLINIGGTTTLIPAAGTGSASLPGGVLALQSNSGAFSHNEFSVVPEVRAQLSYNLRSWLQVSAGYNFLYWNHVVRPGDQISTTVSAAQAPSSPSYAPGTTTGPSAPRNSSDFWTQGVSFGVTLRY